jgi:hypothetical protein
MTDFNFTPPELDSMRAAVAILRAADRENVTAIELLVNGGDALEIVQSLAALTLSITKFIGMDVQDFTAFVAKDITRMESERAA